MSEKMQAFYEAQTKNLILLKRKIAGWDAQLAFYLFIKLIIKVMLIVAEKALRLWRSREPRADMR